MYLWLKAAHIVAVISWMAGMLYLPRLFVYHADAPIGSDKSETFKVMEHRLYRFIMTPAMIAVFAFGLYLANEIGFAPWLHAKLALVLVLAGYQGFLSRCRKNFAAGKNQRSEKFYRIINEIPAVLMVIIVALVVLKPF